MTFVWVFDFATFLATLMALIILWSGWRRVALQRGTKWVLIGLLALLMFHGFSNVLEWSGITGALDPYEDYIQIMEPLFWGFFLYAFLQDITDEDLRKSEEKYRTLFEDSRDTVYITSRDGKFIEINQTGLDLFGYAREEMVGLDVMKIYVNPDDRKRFQDEIEQKDSVRNYEMKFKKKDGTGMDCLVTSTVRRTEDGKIFGYQGIIRDITEHKKAEKELKQKLEELEKMNRLMVGRELKMIELKEQIKELEEKIAWLKERAK